MESLYSRHSHGLEQFFTCLGEQEGLSVLDLAGVSQANVGFITSLGHRLYAEDFLQTLDASFGDSDTLDNQSDPERLDLFLRQSLVYPEHHFDGVLVWDTLEYLAPPLLKMTVDRLFKILKPECYLLAFFHTDEKAESVALYRYRISDASTLLLSPRGARRPVQLFNNRGLERLFQRFRSVKFFLARDHLREVIVRR